MDFAHLIHIAIPHASTECIASYAGPLSDACREFAIDTPQRLAPFLANVAAESGSLTRVTENLNYSADALLRVFPSHFSPVEAQQYARQPERIANRAYANRMGNGPEASGDGWRYRGRGLLQITGLSAYLAAGQGMGTDLSRQPDYLETPEGAARSAAWYWADRGLNAYADAGDFDSICDIINLGHKTKQKGDAIGYAERLSAYQLASTALLS